MPHEINGFEALLRIISDPKAMDLSRRETFVPGAVLRRCVRDGTGVQNQRQPVELEFKSLAAMLR